MRKYPVSDKISRFASIFKENGFSLYIVGGAVRDWLLGIQNSDYDFCTDALPEQVISIFRKVIPTGIKHGTVTVLFQGVQAFRKEPPACARWRAGDVSPLLEPPEPSLLLTGRCPSVGVG